MTDESQQDRCATRRCVLLGAGVLGATGLLSACSTAAVPYDANQAGQPPAPAGQPTTATMAPAAAGGAPMSSAPMSSPASGAKSSGGMSSPSSGAPAGGTALGLAADIPVGGGKVYQAAQVVVTQPTAGQYKAFSAICTHVGCICNQVAGGTINCPCHGAKFKITDGSVVAGPATVSLATASVTVAGGKIYLQ
jgi:Rieske Fe-S protein